MKKFYLRNGVDLLYYLLSDGVANISVWLSDFYMSFISSVSRGWLVVSLVPGTGKRFTATGRLLRSELSNTSATNHIWLLHLKPKFSF